MNRKILRRVAVSAAVLLSLASLKWPQVQGIATILLLLVTLEYVLLTQENIELFRRQLRRQEKIYVNFELICRNGPLFVRVANLGIANFLVSGIRVRTQDIREFYFAAQEVVESGKIAELSLPREVCNNHPLTVDLEIVLECVGQDVRGKSEPQVFNVGMALDNIPNSVKRGFDGLWSIACPRCREALGGLMAMSLAGLKTFDQAFARKNEVLEDFRNSCPNHDSKFLLKMGGAEEPSEDAQEEGELDSHTSAISGDDQRRIELWDEHRKQAQEDIQSSTDSFDKNLLTVSSAALGFSIVFIKDIVPLNKAVWHSVLYASWLCFAACIVITVFSFQVSVAALRKHLEYLQQYYQEKDETFLNKKSLPEIVLKWFTWAAAVFFLAGIICTVVFCIKNLV